MEERYYSEVVLYVRVTIILVLILSNIIMVGQKNSSSDIEITNNPVVNRAFIDSLNKKAFSIFRTNPSETRKIALKNLSLSQAINYPTGEGKANNYIAMTYHLSGDFDSSYIFYQNALEIFQADNDTLNIGKIYNNLALLFTNREYYHLALQYNLKSLEFAKLMNDKKGVFHSYNNIGITYERLGEYEKAIDSYNNSLKTIEQEANTDEFYYYAISNIAVVNLLTHQYNSVETQLNRGLTFFISANDNYGISQSYRYLGEFYIETGNYKQAEVSLEKSNKYATKIDDKKILLENQFLLAKLHFVKKEFSKAKIIFKNTLKEAQSSNSINTEIESLNYIAKIDSIAGNYFNALKNFQASIVLRDSLNSLKIKNQIAEFSIQYETMQKDLEIAGLKQSYEMKELEIAKGLEQRNLIFIILLALITFIIYGLFTKNKIRKKNELLTLQNDEIDKKNLELLAHRNQLEELVEQRTEELVISRDKAQESDRLKSAFLANMSHEIRTPMNGILGFTNMLKDTNLDSVKQKNYIDIITRSGERMLNTVNNIIEVSKIETGQVDVVNSDFSIEEMGYYHLNFFLPEASKKSIKLSFHPDYSIKSNIRCDKNKLESIISNLLKNAIKYTSRGVISFGYKYKNNELEFFVKDTGIGIPSNRKEAIFDHFTQADIEDRMAYQGAGLGLSIVKSYVELLNGKVWVVSEENKGSTFYFTMPCEQPNILVDAKEIITKETTILKPIKILVVEDDETCMLHLKIILEEFASELLFAKSGTEAVEICKRNTDIDLVLMDIRLPEMDGFQATKAIREFNTTIIIIAQTAYALVGDREEAINSGCNNYISKPIDKDNLYQLISSYF